MLQDEGFNERMSEPYSLFQNTDMFLIPQEWALIGNRD